MNTAAATAEERQAALAALAGRIRENGADDPRAERQVRALETAGEQIGHRAAMATGEYGEDEPPPTAARNGDRNAGSLRPVDDFLQSGGNGTPAKPRQDGTLDWPYARGTAEPDAGCDPGREQREVRIAVTGGKWDSQTTMDDILDSIVARTDGAPVRIITGERGGAERRTAEWARKRDVPIDIYETDWDQGRGAGYRRNEDVLAEANPGPGRGRDARTRPPELPPRRVRRRPGHPRRGALHAPREPHPDGLYADLAAISRTPTAAQRAAEDVTAMPDTAARTPGERPIAPPPALATVPAIDIGGSWSR